MIRRLLVAVDDSAPALEAARFAISLAARLDAHLDVATVVLPGRHPTAVVDHVVALAAARGVEATPLVAADGDQAFEALLALGRERDVDLIVMGRSDKRSVGRPYVGSQTEHLLEFTDVPVVVVPEARRAGRSSAGPVAP